jgi:hypothetical protein
MADVTGTTGGTERPGEAERVDEVAGAAGPVVGDVVAGVRLTSLVGAGATGQVWAGTQVSDGARVAVKLLDPAAAALSGRSGAAEGRLLAGVRHPHVLAVRRVCTDPPAVVTDLAEGGSLADQVAVRGCLGAGELVTVLAPLADTLAFLHGRGLVHGDVTAANVLFVERGRPVLADLGGARLAGTGEVVATPGYAAPEVRAGAPATPAADVHGLAAVAWFALTGAAPPDLAEDRLPLRLLAPDCPDPLVDVVVQALDPDPGARPEPAELGAAVRAAAAAEPVRLVPAAARGVRADEAITYRVRQAALRDGTHAGPRRRWSAVRFPGLRRRPSRARPASRPGGGGPGRSRRPGLPVLVCGMVTVLVVGGGVLALRGAAPFDHEGSADAARASETRGPAAAAAPAPSTDAGSVEAPGSGLEEAARGLVAARESALRSGDAQALLAVHHPDGETLTPDRDALADGPLEVSYEVLDVTPVPGEPDAVDLTLRTTVPPSAAPGVEQVRLHLRLHDGRWLLAEVSDIRAS